MNNNYTLYVRNVTSTTADVDIYSATSPSTTAFQYGQIAFFKQSSPTSIATVNFTDPGTPGGQKVTTVSLTGLLPETKYIVRVNQPSIGVFYPFTTKISPDTPRISTQEQWEDLADRVNANKDTINSLIAKGSGAPTTSTTGTVGKIYEDTTNGKLYICTAVVSGTPNTYTWETVGNTVVQTAGDSTTSVMSQKAATELVFSNSSDINQSGVQIGRQAIATGLMSVAIGRAAQDNGGSGVVLGYQTSTTSGGPFSIVIGSFAQSTVDSNMALGYHTRANHRGSIALGPYAETSKIGQLQVGTTETLYGYSGNSNYRLISGVYDGISAHDAATKGQLDAISSYSESEVNTGATWIDGSAIYKKTIDTGALPDTAVKNVSAGIGSGVVKKVIKLEGLAYDPFLYLSLELGSHNTHLAYSPDSIEIRTYSDATNFTSSYVTIYYTKN